VYPEATPTTTPIGSISRFAVPSFSTSDRTLTMGERKQQNVFIRDPEFAWLPAIKLDNNDKTATVKVPQYKDEQSIVCDGGKTAKGWEEDEVPLSDYNKGVLPMQNVNAQGDLKAFPDMVNLPFLHEVSRSHSMDVNPGFV
jgi:hypothetical protein